MVTAMAGRSCVDAKEHQMMTDSDWSDIEELRNRLWLQQHQPVSEDFVAQTQKFITERIQDESAVEALRRLI
jgi:serine protease inhibitor